MITLFLAAALPIVCAKDCATEGRKKLDEPKVDYRINQASATRSPWIISNGWRITREPGGKYYYDVPARAATIAVAESFAFHSDAVVRASDGDTVEATKMQAFIKALPVLTLPAVTDFVVVDDGSAQTGEVMNLLIRRNLLFRAGKHGEKSPLVVELGTKEFPKAAAANPSDFAVTVRHKLTDEKRGLRVYGSENVITRFESDGKAARVHVLNYGTRGVEGIRIRVRGTFKNAVTNVFAMPGAKVEELMTEGGFTEFTLMEMKQYAVIDLN